MPKSIVYLMLGYPGAGKTTTAKVIHKLTGAVHLWADHIRRERYGTPTYTPQENRQLYTHLNELTAELLAAQNSVIYDTNFNFYKDRQRLRTIAKAHNAEAVLIWVTTPKAIALRRATNGAPGQHTRVLGDMPVSEFERMSSNLQEPRADEPYIEVDGTRVNQTYIKELLKLP